MPLRQNLFSIVLVTTVSAGVMTTAAQAQQQIFEPGGQQQTSDVPRDPKTGVYVRDSAVAIEKLALAERMERLKEWDKSADVYQEIVEKYADRVVPNQADAAGVAKRYSSVT